jgi:hypothetical protein
MAARLESFSEPLSRFVVHASGWPSPGAARSLDKHLRSEFGRAVDRDDGLDDVG